MVGAIPVLLPVLAFATAVSWMRRRTPGLDRRVACLTVALGAGAYVVLSTELLSLFQALSREWVVATWALPLAVLAAVHWIGIRRQTAVGTGSAVGNKQFTPSSGLAWLLTLKDPVVVAGALVVVSTASVAFLATPNTWDSMTYHMSRVVHWIANDSVRFYPSHISRQLHLAPGAEYAVAHVQILAGSDRFANLVQFASMLGSICAVTLIAKDMRASVHGQRLAALVALTLPMGVLQAATTQNDHVAGLWILAFVLFGRRWTIDHCFPDLICAVVALALAILTKSTAFIIAAPFVVWFAVAAAVRHRWRIWRPALLIVLAVAAINAGHMGRNTALYGRPFGPLGEGRRAYINDEFSMSALASNSTRNLALQLATSIEPINRRVERAVRLVHRSIGVDADAPELTWYGLTFYVPASGCHEDGQGAPLHMLLFAGVIATAMVRRSHRLRLGPVGAHLLATVVAALLFALLLRWQPWHTRLHLPIMLLAAPPAATILTRTLARPLVLASALILTLAAAPCVLRAHARPLLGRDSVVTAPRSEQYFRNNPALMEPYREVAARIHRDGASRVGLICGTDDWEYPLWALTGGATTFVHVGVENASRVLADPDADQALDFIVCTGQQACEVIATREGWRITLETPAALLLSRE